MASLDVSLYSVGLGIVLIVVYIFPSFHIQRIFGKVSWIFNPWLHDPRDKIKGEAIEAVELSQASENPHQTIEKVSQYSSSWWTDEKIFQLERRGIFSKTWLYVTHMSRFHKPGDYRTFEIAGFSFILILGKDKHLRAFHNVCRHRAYAVTRKESGSSTVLGCRYHGWSYDTNGKLIKAPEFEGVKGFDKDMNGLWEVRTSIRDSMVFVNFDATEDVRNFDLEVPENWIVNSKIAELGWVGGWKLDGNFNWKLAVGDFSLDEPEEKGLWKAFLSTWDNNTRRKRTFNLFPNTIIRQLSSGQLLIISFLPQSATTTVIQCDIYASKSRNTREYQKERLAMKESIQLEVTRFKLKQKEILNGDDHYSRAPQDKLSLDLKAHLKAEQIIGSEIHPAAKNNSFTPNGKADDDLCRELESNMMLQQQQQQQQQYSLCSANRNGLLDW